MIYNASCANGNIYFLAHSNNNFGRYNIFPTTLDVTIYFYNFGRYNTYFCISDWNSFRTKLTILILFLKKIRRQRYKKAKLKMIERNLENTTLCTCTNIPHLWSLLTTDLNTCFSFVQGTNKYST